MTTMMLVPYRCAVCGATEKFPLMLSTSTFGSPDLDLRPAPLSRSTMPMWVQECPECGYVSESISDCAAVTREWLSSERYHTCGGFGFTSDLAARFYRQYLIAAKGRNVRMAMFAALHAAWSCDDTCDEANAKSCREIAIPPAAELIGTDPDDRDELMVMRADMMRRAGQYGELIEQYSSVRFGNENLNRLIRFEIEKAKDEDARCYCVADAVEQSGS